jgi:hypothetical protein
MKRGALSVLNVKKRTPHMKGSIILSSIRRIRAMSMTRSRILLLRKNLNSQVSSKGGNLKGAREVTSVPSIMKKTKRGIQTKVHRLARLFKTTLFTLITSKHKVLKAMMETL